MLVLSFGGADAAANYKVGPSVFAGNSCKVDGNDTCWSCSIGGAVRNYQTCGFTNFATKNPSVSLFCGHILRHFVTSAWNVVLLNDVTESARTMSR